jgi:hypothetical protein
MTLVERLLLRAAAGSFGLAVRLGRRDERAKVGCSRRG